MYLLDQLLRVVMGKRPKVSPLDKLFLSEPSAECGIVLEETGFPYGGVSTLAWWKSNGLGFFKMSHRAFREVQPKENCNAIYLPADQVDELLRSIEEKYHDLENYLRNVRDGGVYVVSWGTKERQRVVTIKTPLPDRHFQLVKELKESAMT